MASRLGKGCKALSKVAAASRQFLIAHSRLSWARHHTTSGTFCDRNLADAEREFADACNAYRAALADYTRYIDECVPQWARVGNEESGPTFANVV
jgi:hypothetical protein